MFSNIAANTKLTTTVGYGFRQLTQSEFDQYCQAGVTSSISSSPVLSDSYDFQSLLSEPFSRLIYASGCYYIQESSVVYMADGIEVYSDSNSSYTHCVSTHLTEFAGGFIILPDAMNFNVDPSFTKNMTIYLTVIILFCLYIILFVLCRYMDWRDDKKRCVYFLEDNYPGDAYFYEMIVFTGGRRDAGTRSNVCYN